MAERIMISPQELNDGATFLRQRLEAINQEVSALKNKIDDVSSRWEGAAQQSFVSQFENEVYPVLRDRLPEVIEGIAGNLDISANTLREADASISNAYN